MSQTPSGFEFQDGKDFSFGDPPEDDDDDGQENDPTSVVNMLKEYQASRRQSLLAAKRRESTRMTLIPSQAAMIGAGRKIDFESFNASTKRSRLSSIHQKSKISKLDLDNISIFKDSGLRGDSPKRPSPEQFEKMRQEIEMLKTKLAEKDAAMAECQARTSKWETTVKNMELDRKRDKLWLEQEKDRLNIERKRFTKEIDDLKYQIRKNKEKDDESHYQESQERRKSNQNRYQLEGKIASLENENAHQLVVISQLENELERAKFRAKQESSASSREIQQLKSQLEEAKERESRSDSKTQSIAKLQKELDEVILQMKVAVKEKEKAEHELQKNADAVKQREMMKERIEKYPSLVKENESLKMENKLLVDTQENIELLKEENSDVKEHLKRLEKQIEEGLKEKNELEYALKRIQNWESVCRKMFSYDELNSGNITLSPDTLSSKISALQRREIESAEDNHFLQSRLSEECRKVSKLSEETEKQRDRISQLETRLEESQKLVEKLQRKLLLVSKERDSFRGILDSYEKELTLTAGQFDKDRIEALEKIISVEKDIIEKLETQLSNQSSGTSETKGLNEKAEETLSSMTDYERRIGQLNKNNEELRKECDALKTELEKKASKLDYDPMTTKVIHLSDNPTSELTKNRGEEIQRLSKENERLKTRIQLLEEGQTKDLTMLVGQKVEEGVSSKEVQELREQLKSAEVKRERILAAFRKTSQDFREVCCQLTGYRIDALANNHYRLTPIYAESNEDHLLFLRDSSGECHLLQTRFSDQLNEFIDIHLNRQNSIPIFLAAVITDLFSRQTFDNTESTTAITDAGGGDDDPICID